MMASALGRDRPLAAFPGLRYSLRMAWPGLRFQLPHVQEIQGGRGGDQVGIPSPVAARR